MGGAGASILRTNTSVALTRNSLSMHNYHSTKSLDVFLNRLSDNFPWFSNPWLHTRHIGWLFLFAVLMAAGLLFCMVFFVSCILDPFLRLWLRLWCTSQWTYHRALFFAADLFTSKQIIMFSDLECDYINPIDLCNKLNQVSYIGFVFTFVSTALTPFTPL